jgi:hypothetical protein
MSIARRRVSLLALALVLAASSAAAATRYDPRLRFRTIRTPHFDIHAHQGEDALARRLAAIAEDVRRRMQPVLGTPRGRVHVILVDQTDLSNGWATPVPYNTIEVAASPPPPESIIGNTTDWLELVFTHEYTHILHLDRSRGFVQGVRRLFGRVPFVFPNGALPIWQVEGLATYAESTMTGEGRVVAGDFRAIVDVAAARGRFEPIDRVSGLLTDWPAGHAPYAYGAYFHQFLAERYGGERLARLADATSGRLPFFGAGAFKQVFGRSERELWREFRDARERAAVRPSRTDARAMRLTRHGFGVDAPRRGADGAIFYSISDADGFPALMRLPPEGRPARVAWRALGGRTSVAGGWVVFDQLERIRSVALHSDLYAVREAGGDVRRLTVEARAGDPDLSPDATRIVCTVQRSGRRALALLAFDPSATRTPEVLLDDEAADLAGPRWSPDGRTIVAERRRAGVHELVLIDPQTRGVRTLVSRRDARSITPSWTSDGASILFAADPGEEPFNVFVVTVATGEVRRVTDTLGGAKFPELAPDGTLTYVGYTPEGYDLFAVPVDALRLKAEAAGSGPAKATGGWPEESRGVAEDPRRFRRQAEAPLQVEDPSTPYRPWRTLVPTFWTPVIETDADELVLGAATAMNDALGRHAYALDAGWAGGRARPDWNAAYAYDRWRPTLFAAYSDDTDPVRDGTVRSREFFAGALLPFRRLRWTETLMAGFDAQTDTLECAVACPGAVTRRDLRSIRGGWLHDSRRVFGYSISPEEGFAIEAAAETSRAARGADADAGAAILVVRGFHRGFRRRTGVAARLAGATGRGAPGTRREFSASGPGPSYPVFDFGRDAIGLIRGFAPEDVTGPHAFVANLDVRFPIARIQRGLGSWPVFVHTIHGAAFVDAGAAWERSLRGQDVRRAVGGELSVDMVFRYARVTVTGGAAWTHDPSADRDRAAAFARIGYAF